MFAPDTYIARRNELRRRIGTGLILLTGNCDAPFNYPNNIYAFRQDSTFLYYFGLNIAGMNGVLDADSGDDELYADDLTVDDIIWTGPQPSVSELAASVGVAKSRPAKALAERIAQALRTGRRIHFLPPYRGETKLQLCELLGLVPSALHDRKSVDLMMAVAEMRECKSDEEIQQIERAFHIGYEMHLTAMRLCRPGAVECEIAGALEGVAKTLGTGVSFPSIVTQHGETLHNHCSTAVLESGRLLLVDAGGESSDYYCSDHTRTYPVNGKFTDRQRDIYNIVLSAHDHIAATVKPGMMYHEQIHLESYRILAEGLIGIGLIRGTASDAVASGAMTMFMPHGLGHGIGMDVHDCEAIGERSFDFSPIAERASASATCIYRKSWRMREGTVLSDEPGIYFIPALIDKSRAEGLYRGIVDYEKLESYRDFGGIRIEDDLIVTATGCRMVGGDKRIPITVDELESELNN